MSLTLEQFLEKLEQTPRDWYLYGSRKVLIRRMKGKNAAWSQCPVSSLFCRNAGDYRSAALDLGLSQDLAEMIAAAADGWPDHEPDLRAKLLKACGLA
jgi:hypothetical protein